EQESVLCICDERPAVVIQIGGCGTAGSSGLRGRLVATGTHDWLRIAISAPNGRNMAPEVRHVSRDTCCVSWADLQRKNVKLLGSCFLANKNRNAQNHGKCERWLCSKKSHPMLPCFPMDLHNSGSLTPDLKCYAGLS